jgi:sec-independent protein translocase protein TatB
MFDVGFWELAVIFVIGLLVLGPQRLPQVARQMGQWAGRARRMARMLSTQLQDELDGLDPRRIMDPQQPPPDYSRPGMDALKPGGAAGEQDVTETEPGAPHAAPGDDRP